MQQKKYRIRILNSQLEKLLECEMNENVTGEDILELYEAFVKNQNQASVNLKGLEIYSQFKKKVMNIKETLHEILKSQENDELIIRNQSLSKLSSYIQQKPPVYNQNNDEFSKNYQSLSTQSQIQAKQPVYNQNNDEFQKKHQYLSTQSQIQSQPPVYNQNNDEFSKINQSKNYVEIQSKSSFHNQNNDEFSKIYQSKNQAEIQSKSSFHNQNNDEFSKINQSKNYVEIQSKASFHNQNNDEFSKIYQSKNQSQIQSQLPVYNQNNDEFSKINQPKNQSEIQSKQLIQNKNNEIFIFQNQYLSSQSELQHIQILIKLCFNQISCNKQQSFQFSRHDQLSKVGDKVLQWINKKKEECGLKFTIKGKDYWPFFVNLSLIDLNLINQDEILVEILFKLVVVLQDGKDKSYDIYINQYKRLSDLFQEVLIKFSLKEEGLSMEFQIKNDIYNQSQFDKTLSELNIEGKEKIIARVRYSGGSSNKRKSIYNFRKQIL
ncbi:unnamed protein product [Paramecium sonneborni]|uniref:Uncharacterized protein n=1 Tax=Paramecium sonneborni TaxID=65129 RepID=A0A8S1JW84_9CILI|nr:unnamed protein product [Paramecium sonneborni]